MPTFNKVNTRLRMPEAIVHQIENKILLGHLKPDQRLPLENRLMEQFGVGRNTVREALRILETSGLIKAKQGSRGGPVITKLTNEIVSDFLIKVIHMGGVSPNHLSQFRLALELSIAEILAAMKNINQEILSQMENYILEVKPLFERNEVTACQKMDFHVLIAEATENPMFVIILKTLRVGFNLISPPQNKIQMKTSFSIPYRDPKNKYKIFVKLLWLNSQAEARAPGRAFPTIN